MSDTYTITELSGEFEITPRTIRFYEDKELLRPGRNGMNRVYSRGDRVRLKLILRGKRLGFSLDEIKEMLDLYHIGDGQVGQLRLTLRKSRERIGTLQCQRQDIDQALEELEEGCRAIERLLADKGVGAHEV